MAEREFTRWEHLQFRWWSFTMPLRVAMSTQRECGCRLKRITGKTWAYCGDHFQAECRALLAKRGL